MEPWQPQGEAALQPSAAAPNLPAALQSLRELLSVQNFVSARPRKLGLLQVDSLSSAMLPLLSRLGSSPALPEGPPGQTQQHTPWQGPFAILYLPGSPYPPFSPPPVKLQSLNPQSSAVSIHSFKSFLVSRG